ncbi:MAG: hypothetical protein FWD23_03940 [Oscillospiraceae bacterium]|nr:hypothetical protein [Oscillospiraceae bacterium]
MENIDLLYPGEEYKNYRLNEFSFIDELNLYNILELNPKEFNLSEYFTNSKEVIEYRSSILDDFIKNGVLQDINEIIKITNEIKEIRERKNQSSELIAILYSIFEIEIYIDLIKFLNEFFSRYDFKSNALIKLKENINTIATSENYINLSAGLANFRVTADNIKSVTIGVNLNDNLKPYEAGVVSINTEKYRSGNLFDRILSLDIKDDGYRCLAPLSPVKNVSENYSLMLAFNNALENIVKTNLKSWQAVTRLYFVEKTNYLIDIARDLRFYCAFVKFAVKCGEKFLNIVKPDIVSGDSVYYKDIYNINIALYSGESNEIVYNDAEFDKNGKIYILTGPNQGGKSVFLKALGINQALFQLGSYVNASEAKMKISSEIIIYLTKNNEKSIGYGHLGEECNAVSKLLKYAQKDCLCLFDEAFSSTSASDQCYIACEVLTALSKLKCYGLFITHNHDIYDKIKDNDLNGGDSAFDSLVALMSGGEETRRSYKIVRKAPDRNSFAIDIAKKYNLQCEDILKGGGAYK